MDPTALAIIGWFVQVLLDQGITFAIDHWGSGAAGDPDLPGALGSLENAMIKVSAFMPLAQSIKSENEGLLNWMKELKDAAYEADDIFSELEYYRLHQQVEGDNYFLLNNQATTSSSASSNLVPQINNVAGRLEKITTEIRRILGPLKLESQQNPHVSRVASHRITTSLLPEDQYLSLFNTYAFGDENPSDYPSLVKIGKQIAGRLKGSPLAAKTVGGLLSEKLTEDHWSSIRDSDLWQLPQSNDDIMPALQLSYQHLPPHLQQCFTYCCVFPKDWKFEKDKVVAMWISNGYVVTKSDENKSVEEIGSQYFDALLSRSFIEAYDSEWYVLHDLLHDLAQSVSENEYLEINRKTTKKITPSVRHVFVDSNNLDLLKGYNLRNLRTLIIDGSTSGDYSMSGDDSVLEEVLNGLKSVRVLNLEWVSADLLSGSIGRLIHLRYLAVKVRNQSLPPYSQCRPYHLQWLIIKDGQRSVLPAATEYLISLRHLLCEPNKISKVYFTVEKNEGRKLAELKRLNELRGTLVLDFLDYVSTKEEALEASLSKKVFIRELTLSWEDWHESPQKAEKVFEGLCPPPYIKELKLNYYVGVESPTWMMTVNGCLSVLQSLTLYNCFNWKVLPPLGQLPLLRCLEIYGANAVEEIGSSFYGADVANSFPCLETLVFEEMLELVVWSGDKEDTDSLFPRLSKLTVIYCPNLERVPMQCLASVEALQMSCMVLLANCGEIQSLLTLEIEFCDVQSLFTTETKLPSLREITITKCDQLQSLFTTETETKFPSLREMTIFSCDQLVSVELKSLPSLKRLKIRHCGAIQSVPLLPAALEELKMEWLPITGFSREQEENLSDLTSLQKITIKYCHQLHSLPLMPASLRHLYILACPELPQERYQEGGDDWHKISHVPDIDWHKYLPCPRY